MTNKTDVAMKIIRTTKSTDVWNTGRSTKSQWPKFDPVAFPQLAKKVEGQNRDIVPRASALRHYSASVPPRVRLSYAAPGCYWFLDRSENTCSTRAQQEDSGGIRTRNLLTVASVIV